MHDPNTFSSEIGDVHEQPARRDSFSDEFRGVESRRDSFSDEFRGVPEPTFHDRPPPRPLEVGRRGRRIMTTIVLILAVIGGGGALFWFNSAEIGAWIAGLGPEAEPAEEGAETEGEAGPGAEGEGEGQGEPDKEFGIKGVPGDSAPPSSADGGGTASPSVEPETPTPEPTPTPAPAPTEVSVASTEVRGKVGKGRIESKLKGADEALATCWAEAVAKGASRPAELTIEFRIKWNGRRSGVSFTGGTPALESCVTKELPTGGWPQPRDGGEAKVTRTWSLS